MAEVKEYYSYTAREWDEKAGLYFYRARYYDAAIGRFVTVDPIKFAGGINFYPYTANSPINWIDPWGLIWVTTGHEYSYGKNTFRWYLNRLTEQISRGLDPTFPGADIEEYIGLKRVLIQEWRKDPNNPCRDKEHPIGSKRRMQQTFMKLFKDVLNPNVYNDNRKGYYHQWTPWVNSNTY